MACETARRLIALLRLVQRGPASSGTLTDEAMIDDCFGPGAPLPADPQLKDWPCTYCDNPTEA
ncbi:hypothetical protein GCM10009804_59000 [Kribbella hippodromi]|uniref:Uncharacterized protein n=1 Tax=Kribbella hippodromi TaxID=434347 RepID=A0ABN2E2S7_9ACTN